MHLDAVVLYSVCVDSATCGTSWHQVVICTIFRVYIWCSADSIPDIVHTETPCTNFAHIKGVICVICPVFGINVAQWGLGVTSHSAVLRSETSHCGCHQHHLWCLTPSIPDTVVSLILLYLA